MNTTSFYSIDTLPKLKEYINDRETSVVGAGISNIPLIEMLLHFGARLTVHDKQELARLDPTVRALDGSQPLGSQPLGYGVRFVCGEGYLSGLAPLIFKSPGVKLLQPEFELAIERGAIVTSEMELFYQLCPCPIFAVTGSDGKTTTTTLIAELLREAGATIHLGGNIGAPLLPEIESIAPGDIAVLELSSFQLQAMPRAKGCDLAVVTNVTPNHLDYHRDMEEYIASKKNIYVNQMPSGVLVLNHRDPITHSFAQEAKGRVRYFSLEGRPTAGYIGAYFYDKAIWYADEAGSHTRLLETTDIFIPGLHNVDNFMAAITATRDYLGPEPQELLKHVARSFRGVAHRMEFVRELRGVKFYESSIDSSPTRTIAAIRSFTADTPLVLIMGGKGKGVPYDPLVPVMLERGVRSVILTGHSQTAAAIRAAIENHPDYTPDRIEIIDRPDFADAVRCSFERAKPGWCVVLSPANTSFDVFKNFEQRGNLFKEIVNSLV